TQPLSATPATGRRPHPEPLSIPRSRPRAPTHANCPAELPSPAPPGHHPRTASSSYEPTVPTRRCVVPPPPPSAPPAERTAPLAASDRSSSSMASPSPLLRSGPQPRPEQETMTRGNRAPSGPLPCSATLTSPSI